ncbi:MAG: YfiR family protein [Flavobacteriales bacterium]|nr:YfiR family protein [Flavobacteriales bacterium]
MFRLDMILGIRGAKGSPAPRRTTWSRAVMLFVASVVLTASAPQRELEKDTSAILQASYIYNIAKLVEWKDPAMSSGTFIIGVIGGANLYQEMIKKYSTKSIGKQPIEVRKLPRSSTVDRCHILFVGQSDIALMPEIYRNLAGKSTLIITEYPDALEDGSVANFVRTDNTLKYEMSVVNARKHKLEVALTLKQLALRVEE